MLRSVQRTLLVDVDYNTNKPKGLKMLYYGYAFDWKDAKRSLRGKVAPGYVEGIEDSGLFISCYTVGAWTPNMAMLGVKIAGDSCLFNPVPVKALAKEVDGHPNQLVEAAKAVDAEFARLYLVVREAILANAVDKEPQLYLFETTDD
jgi:hypothetical protein